MDIMSFEEFSEKISVPVKVGDIIYMGKYKNKKTIVKSIGKDEHGMPTINGKKAVTFRTKPPKKKDGKK
jgi:hypothetical protein